MAEERKIVPGESRIKKIGTQARVVDGGSPVVRNPSEDSGQNANIRCLIIEP